MRQAVVIPELGYSIVEATILKWHRQPGDAVQKGEVLAEIETEKATVEIEAPEAGVVAEILFPEGTTVKKGADIARLEVAGAGAPAAAGGAAPAAPVPPTPAAARPATPDAGALPRSVEPDARKHSPLVRALAERHQIDLSRVQGTGPGGRVTKEDILGFLEQEAGATPAPERPPAAAATGPAERPQEIETLALTPTRRTIARNMVWSKTHVPHAGGEVEVDMSRVVGLRAKVLAEFQAREGFGLTYLPFIVLATSRALTRFPVVNASYQEGEGGKPDQIQISKHHHIGIAAAAPRGLVVPVIHACEQKAFRGIAREVHRLTDRAREGKLSLDDVMGGTFTINNPGALGSIRGFQIITPPQAGILGVGKIVKRPVVIEVDGQDAIAIRPIMCLDLFFDHRVFDGDVALGFLEEVRGQLESFDASFLD